MLSTYYKNGKYAQTHFTAMVQAWSADLYRYAFWLCRNRTMAEELVQETFLRAWRSLDSLRDESAAKGWLITILRREHARQYQRKTLLIDDDVDPDQFGESSFAMGAETLSLRKALGEISTDYSEPLLLQVLGGFSTEEIADLLGISRAAVMTRLFRARQKLHAILEKGENLSVDQELPS